MNDTYGKYFILSLSSFAFRTQNKMSSSSSAKYLLQQDCGLFSTRLSFSLFLLKFVGLCTRIPTLITGVFNSSHGEDW